MRVDIERHFEGVPRTKIRDLVSVRRPTPNEKSIDVAIKVAHKSTLASHTIDHHKDVIMPSVAPNVPNFGDTNIWD